jgi:hypothetical protein
MSALFRKLLLDIKNYLYEFSMQKPELFKQLQLPSPRTDGSRILDHAYK